MRSIPQPQRQDGPAMADADLVALIAGTPGSAPGLRPVADILAALTAEATAGELAGEGRAMAEFRRRARAPETRRHARRSAGRPRIVRPRNARPRATRLTYRLGVKLGAAATGVAVVLGGAATAAFAGMLPAPIQRFAHEIIGAPIPRPRHGLPTHGRPAAPGGTAPGPALARRTPRAQARPSPSPNATGPGNVPGRGQPGKPHTRAKQGNAEGPGQPGSGQHGNGQGEPGSGKGQGGSGARQGASPHATTEHSSPRQGGLHRNPQAQRRQGHPHTTARRAVRPARLARAEVVIEL